MARDERPSEQFVALRLDASGRAAAERLEETIRSALSDPPWLARLEERLDQLLAAQQQLATRLAALESAARNASKPGGPR